MASQTLQSVMNKDNQFERDDVTKYLRYYGREMKFQHISDSEMLNDFEIAVVSDICSWIKINKSKSIQEVEGKYFIENSEGLIKLMFLE